jgi:pectinesterase
MLALASVWRRGAGILLVAPSLLAAQASFGVRVTNALSIARPDETIAVAWNVVTAKLAGSKPSMVRVRDDASGREVVSQVVDNDGDGTVDELIFQASFSPAEVKRFTVEAAAPAAPPAVARVYAAHMAERDDMAWESDRIAFRMYGQGLWKVDSLNSSGIDVWVKRVRTPIVEKWYGKGHDSYHRDTGEGADFFDVGETLGLGGTAVWKDGVMYRAYNFKTWRIIANGPVRAIFEVEYEPWNARGLVVRETKRIAIDAGQNMNRVTSTFRTASGTGDVPFTTGIVKRKGVVGSTSRAQAWAWITHWGLMSPKDGGHDNLGIAVMLPKDRLDDWKETVTHYLALSHARSGEPVSYYIGAGWTGSGDFRDVTDWWNYLDAFAQRLGSPLAVAVVDGGR